MSDAREILRRHEKPLYSEYLALARLAVREPTLVLDVRDEGPARITGGARLEVVQGLVQLFPHVAADLAAHSPGAGRFQVIVVTAEGAERHEGLTWGHRVYRSCRERAEVEFLRAREKGIDHPAILIDTRAQEERRLRAEARHDFPEGWEVAHASLTIGTRPQLATRLAPLSREAAEYLAVDPPPGRPFTVVVIGDDRLIELFNEPAPEPGSY